MSLVDFTNGNNYSVEELNLKNPESIEFEKYGKFDDTSFYMNDESGELDYDSSCVLNNVHWGQLKLLSSEFFVIMRHLPDTVKTILYVGGANGSHIYVLAKMFPDLTFHLYDSQSFDKRLYKLPNVKIYKKYYDEREMIKWKQKDIPLFFISDIRNLTYDPSAKDDQVRVKNEENVWNDMKLQEKWIKELQPQVSLVKFRLPFAYDFVLREGKTRKYLDGQVCFQIYNKPTSSETRLLVKDIKETDWDLLAYEKKMYYHNCITRNKKKYKNPINNSNKEIYPKKGLYNDYDSVYLTILVMDYIRRNDNRVTEKKVKEKLSFILNNISGKGSNLNSKRAGF